MVKFAYKNLCRRDFTAERLFSQCNLSIYLTSLYIICFWAPTRYNYILLNCTADTSPKYIPKFLLNNPHAQLNNTHVILTSLTEWLFYAQLERNLNLKSESEQHPSNHRKHKQHLDKYRSKESRSYPSSYRFVHVTSAVRQTPRLPIHSCDPMLWNTGNFLPIRRTLQCAQTFPFEWSVFQCCLDGRVFDVQSECWVCVIVLETVELFEVVSSMYVCLR